MTLLHRPPPLRRRFPATLAEKLARVATLAELDGWVAALAHREREPGAEELQAIARRRAELMKEARS